MEKRTSRVKTERPKHVMDKTGLTCAKCGRAGTELAVGDGRCNGYPTAGDLMQFKPRPAKKKARR